MRRVGLFEAKQKLSELVERASRGERIGKFDTETDLASARDALAKGCARRKRG